MFGRLLEGTIRFLAATVFRLLVRAFWLLLGGLLSAVIRFTPVFFRLSVAGTVRVLALVDGHLEGRLASRVPLTVLSAGGMWAVIGFATPLLVTLTVGARPVFFCAPLVVCGFAYGIFCGFRVSRLPGWGSWAEQGSLRLGEDI